MLGREAELLLQIRKRRRSAERVHHDLRAEPADIAVPTERRGLLDCDSRVDVRRQNRVLIRLVLPLEQIP